MLNGYPSGGDQQIRFRRSRSRISQRDVARVAAVGARRAGRCHERGDLGGEAAGGCNERVAAVPLRRARVRTHAAPRSRARPRGRRPCARRRRSPRVRPAMCASVSVVAGDQEQARGRSLAAARAGLGQHLVGLLLRQPRIAPRELLALERGVRHGVVVRAGRRALPGRTTCPPRRAGEDDRAESLPPWVPERYCRVSVSLGQRRNGREEALFAMDGMRGDRAWSVRRHWRRGSDGPTVDGGDRRVRHRRARSAGLPGRVAGRPGRHTVEITTGGTVTFSFPRAAARASTTSTFNARSEADHRASRRSRRAAARPGRQAAASRRTRRAWAGRATAPSPQPGTYAFVCGVAPGHDGHRRRHRPRRDDRRRPRHGPPRRPPRPPTTATPAATPDLPRRSTVSRDAGAATAVADGRAGAAPVAPKISSAVFKRSKRTLTVAGTSQASGKVKVELAYKIGKATRTKTL